MLEGTIGFKPTLEYIVRMKVKFNQTKRSQQIFAKPSLKFPKNGTGSEVVMYMFEGYWLNLDLKTPQICGWILSVLCHLR